MIPSEESLYLIFAIPVGAVLALLGFVLMLITIREKRLKYWSIGFLVSIVYFVLISAITLVLFYFTGGEGSSACIVGAVLGASPGIAVIGGWLRAWMLHRKEVLYKYEEPNKEADPGGSA